MNCPKCRCPMEPVKFQDVELDRCTHCKGLWFDAGEHEALKKLAGSEKVDVGRAAVGRKYDKIQTATCPRCNVEMRSIPAPHQRHITLDSCPTCGGVFMDAGEFKDFKDEGLWDFIQQFLHKDK